MTTRREQPLLVAVQPSCRGFGFVVLAARTQLVDWGLYGARTARNDACVRRLGRLLDAYRPDVVVVENTAAPECLRRPRVRDLVHAMRRLAEARRIPVRLVRRRRMLQSFARLGARNKHEIARAVASLLPDLALRLPPPRKPWMSQDERYALFDAAAFALTAHAARLTATERPHS